MIVACQWNCDTLAPFMNNVLLDSLSGKRSTYQILANGTGGAGRRRVTTMSKSAKIPCHDPLTVRKNSFDEAARPEVILRTKAEGPRSFPQPRLSQTSAGTVGRLGR